MDVDGQFPDKLFLWSNRVNVSLGLIHRIIKHNFKVKLTSS